MSSSSSGFSWFPAYEVEPEQPVITRPVGPRQEGAPGFPMLVDIYDVVPLPLIHYEPPPIGSDYSANACRLVRDITREPPSFESNPVCFTLPEKAGIFDEFVAAMRTTVAWTSEGSRFNGSLGIPSELADEYYKDKRKPGPARLHEKTWFFNCPCYGPPKVNENVDPITGQKRETKPSYKIFCHARFVIKERIKPKLFEVTWHWKHKGYNPYSLEDMVNMRMSKALEQWLSDRVLEGMNWKAIKKLLRCPDLFPVSR